MSTLESRFQQLQFDIENFNWEQRLHEKEPRACAPGAKQDRASQICGKNGTVVESVTTRRASIKQNCSKDETGQSLQPLLKDPRRKIRYLLCLDVEATCDKAYGFGEYPNEIIELPCVIYDLDACVEVESFRTFVRPTHQPVLSDFCRRLTGITQEQVDAAPDFPTALRLLQKFLSGHVNILHPAPLTMQHVHGSGLAGYAVPPPTRMSASKRKFLGLKHERHGQRPREVDRNWAWATDGRWDIEEFIVKKQLKITGPTMLPLWMSGSYVDIRMLFAEHFKQNSNKNLEGMLAHVHLCFQGRQHSGLADARNVAILARELQKLGCLIEANRWVSCDGATGLVPNRTTRANAQVCK